MMDFDPVAIAAATTVVTAMATEGYQTARSAVVRFWQRVRPHEVPSVEAELDAVRGEVLAAREAGDDAQERELAVPWKLRLQRMLAADPALGAELERMLDEELAPLLRTEDRARVQQQIQHVTASAPGAVAQGVLGGGNIINYPRPGQSASTE
jgi:hypothetical protein